MLLDRAKVTAALGEHRMIPIMKADVIAYCAVTDWTPERREQLYRSWCHFVGCSVLKSDLASVRQARRRELNRQLFEGPLW